MPAHATRLAAQRTAGLSLTRHQFGELEAFLIKLADESGLTTVNALHGCLTAVALLPTGVAFEQWTGLLWRQADRNPSETLDLPQEACLNSYIVRMYDDIVVALGNPERPFIPLVATEAEPEKSAACWCRGFLRGMSVFRESWRGFLADTASRRLLLPIFLLGADAIPAKWRSLVTSAEKRAGLAACIPAIIETMATELLILELTTTLKKKKSAESPHKPIADSLGGAPTLPKRRPSAWVPTY